MGLVGDGTFGLFADPDLWLYPGAVIISAISESARPLESTGVSSWSPPQAREAFRGASRADPGPYDDGAVAVDDRGQPYPATAGGGAHMAMPHLMGQPAYARPPRPLASLTPRPFDPDDLPLEAFRTHEERDAAETAMREWQERQADRDARQALRPSPTGGLRGIAARLLRPGS